MPRALRKKRASPPRRTIKQMDPSQALRDDGVVVPGRLPPELTDNLSDPSTLGFLKPDDRWNEYRWYLAFDLLVDDFEKVRKHKILLAQR
jgi:hypothetical protein